MRLLASDGRPTTPPPLSAPLVPAVNKLGSRIVNAHQFGVIVAVPATVLALGAGLQRSYLRHQGYLDNGNPSFYGPDYKEDAAPYFIKHSSSDRHFDMDATAFVPSYLDAAAHLIAKGEIGVEKSTSTFMKKMPYTFKELS